MEGASICMDDRKLDAPLPLIGLYITGACAICMVAMGIDTIRGFVEKRHWFPCKFFPINATTLALLSVACKLPMDLSTRMPAPQDQLTKLSGTVFVCVSMCFFMPSLGVMTNEQIVANVVALFLFVITVVVDVGTQLATGLIYKFKVENVVVLVCMLLLLGLLCSSAVAKVAAIEILEEKYKEMHKETKRSYKEADMEYVKKDIPKEWVMAHTGNPQSVLARSALSTATGALTCLCVLLLLQAEIRSFFTDFCSGQSSYLWTNWLVLITQTLAVLVGSVAPAFRGLNAARMVAQDRRGLRQWRVDYGIQSFWVKELEDWKRNPLCPYFRNSCSKKTAYVARNMMLDICILLQKASFQLSNVVRLISATIYNKLTSLKVRDISGMCNLGKFSQNSTTSKYVLRLPGENYMLLKWISGEARKDMEQLMEKEWISGDARKDMEQLMEKEWISEDARKDMEQWMEKGRKEKCESLLKLLPNSTQSEGFRNMCLFSHSDVPPIPNSPSHVPPNCWTLPAVTLIAIAVSLSRFRKDRIKRMVNALSEGLEMMKFVEKRLDDTGLASVRKEAEILWSTIDIDSKWLDHDLRNLPINEDDPILTPHMQIIKHLAAIGKEKVEHYLQVSKQSHHWSPEAVLGNSLYRISRTILDFNTYETVDDLLNWIEKILADIVGKCLSRLPSAIFLEYLNAGPTNSETRVRNAVRYLGKADHLFPSLDWSQSHDHVKPHSVEFTCQEKPDDPEFTCQIFPGFPCKHAHNEFVI